MRHIKSNAMKKKAESVASKSFILMWLDEDEAGCGWRGFHLSYSAPNHSDLRWHAIDSVGLVAKS